jgi:hypothetical protein
MTKPMTEAEIDAELAQINAERRRREGRDVHEGSASATALRVVKLRDAPALAEPAVGLREWDAGDDVEIPPPRGWLLGNSFAVNS